MTNWQRAHDLALDGDYTPSVPEEEYDKLNSLLADVQGWCNGDYEDLADMAEALAEQARNIIDWECECGR